MCIVTRKVLPEQDLLRCVLLDQASKSDTVRVIPDPQRKMPGRGAWITPQIDILTLALKRKAFQRAYRIQGSVDTEAVELYLSEKTL